MSESIGKVKFIQVGTVRWRYELIGKVKFIQGGMVKCLSRLER